MSSPIPDSFSLLVVDDIEKNLIAMRALLERPGLTVLTASSGIEALELLLKHEVALALVDVNMPQMDGFELAELIRGKARTKSIPLIFITAALHEPSRTFRGYQAGAVDFLTKPFNPAILRSKVEVFVELYSQRKQMEWHAAELKNALHVNEMYNAVLGHDLRTPLAAIITGAELVMHSSQDQTVIAAAKLIHASGERMGNMVNQLLELARARSAETKLVLAQSDYRTACEEIIREFNGSVRDRQIRLNAEGDTTACFDRGRIAQIFSNLIGNAVQHGVPDTAITVDVNGRQADIVTIKVQNEGWIPEDLLGKVFEPYQSARTGRNGVDGLGLGLYIVNQLVKAHHGVVTVQSQPASGTCFELTMPRAFIPDAAG